MIEVLRDRVRQSEPYQRLHTLLAGLPDGRSVDVERLAGSLRAVVLSALADDLARQVLIVAEDETQAGETADDASLVVGSEAVAIFEAGRAVLSPIAPSNGEDVSALRAMIDLQPSVIVSSVRSLTHRVPPPVLLKDSIIKIERGKELAFDLLLKRLDGYGFVRQQFVQAPGEYALRGGILDVFAFVGDNPLRIELNGDEVESVREFDSLSQRSIRELTSASIVPDLHSLPAHDHTTLLDYLQPNAIIAWDVLTLRPTDGLQLEPAKQVPWEDILRLSETFTRVNITFEKRSELAIDFASISQPSTNSSIRILRSHIADLQSSGHHIFLSADTESELERLRELLVDIEPLAEEEERTAHAVEHHVDVEAIEFSLEALHQGFIYPAGKIAVFTEHQIFNRLKRRGRTQRARFKGISPRELHALHRGDFVVHADYGIGCFDGLKKINVNGTEQEVVTLLYEEKDTLYVNLNYLHKLQKYASKDGHVPKLTRLGSGEWEKLKARAKKRVKDIARDLIRLYAQRKTLPGFSFSKDTLWQRELEASFIYEDTPDQVKATQEVKRDMEAPYPMDRLICGDVGFGKTEVAVRAAFKAVMSGKQVALLVPTTILAQQHYQTFVDRLAHYSTQIEVLSRFKSKAEQRSILHRLQIGSVDIIIGTHRLLSKDVVFKDLGLLIIDEEHRFGVAAKEKLRQLRANVDTLTLTATPIPRTLHFSLLGARDLSIIATPPRNRLPVITEIAEYDDTLIKEAILREVHRGGQVFFVHDRIQNMEEWVARLQALVPHVRMRMAHGQMRAHELEEIMLAFLERRFDVLVATKIIESGIDIPNVNTIIINRADRFGMAELYQLRGRVGRSNTQAYAYLLVPPISSLPRETVRRLQAIEEFTELGAGFHLAMRDLEIRGAGNLLGGEQSGFIEAMGFEMYSKILEEAVAELRKQEFSEFFGQQTVRPEEREQTLVDADVEVRIPEWYLENGEERLLVYRRLFGLRKASEVDAIAAELKDRFGAFPEEVQHLLDLVRLRLKATKLGFHKLSVGKQVIVLEFPPESEADFYASETFQALMTYLSRKQDKRLMLHQKGKTLTLSASVTGSADAFMFAREILDELLHAIETNLAAEPTVSA
ncbi:MAG: transcription-repair coupling factor [Ignavibacteria bacterium]